MSSSENLLPIQCRCKIGETGLLMLDQPIQDSETTSYSCFGVYGTTQLSIAVIPYKSILWVEYLSDKSHAITFVNEKNNLSLETITVDIDDVISTVVPKPTDDYTLINPHGGQGKARTIFSKNIRPVLDAARAKVDVFETQFLQHATQLARELDISQYDIIACCSGDGIPHEVINGLYQRPDRVEAFDKLIVTQLPAGSGNALTLSTHGSNDARISTLRMLKSVRSRMDLMSVTQYNDSGEEETKLSFLSQCYGAIADSDIGTEHLRWMGPIRFDLGVAYKTFSRATYPCDLYVKYLTTTKEELLSHFNEHFGSSKDVAPKSFELVGSSLAREPPSDWIQVDPALTDNLSIFYVGKMPIVSENTPFFPAALPNDGSMDMIITDTRTPTINAVKTLLSVEKGKHVDDDDTKHHKIQAYRLTPRLPEHSGHYISIDGEDFPFRTMQVEVIPNMLNILTPDGKFVSTGFGKS